VRWAVASALWAWSGVALACPTCFNSTADNRFAFIATTVFLSLVPLAFIGGGVYTLRKLTREAAEREAAERAAVEGGAPT